MRKVGVIPARMASTRFPGKPLKEILGIPMLGHIFLRCKMCPDLDELFVATCDEEIKNYIESIGGKAIMTADTHERCTDRTAEAIQSIDTLNAMETDIVVMIQGDEVFVTPEMISKSIKPLIEDETVQVVNLAETSNSLSTHHSHDQVKVVFDEKFKALYFSRAPIPTQVSKNKDPLFWKQVCIIPFRKEFLIRFNQLAPTPLEKIESIDMLRVLEHGLSVDVVPINNLTISVDTPEDLFKAELLMKDDKLFQMYRAQYSQ
jgi:3-deoxy-manno-octulosonate cytidylyltransferase (CMP-KDO synthetase)